MHWVQLGWSYQQLIPCKGDAVHAKAMLIPGKGLCCTKVCGSIESYTKLHNLTILILAYIVQAMIRKLCPYDKE